MKFNLNTNSSTFDVIYRSILLSRFFTKGWGRPEQMKKIFAFRKIISDRNKCVKLVDPKYPIYIEKRVESNDTYDLLEGNFTSPLVNYLPDLIPHECKTAQFQILIPKNHKKKIKPMCLHLAGTGDHYFWTRRNLMAKPLLKEAGIGSIILENPFYGERKPADQKRSSLRNVSDIFIMGGCLVLESLALLFWCERLGFGPLCVTGISMGGHMASLAGCNWPKPISIVPCLSWTTASCAFTQGVMSGAIPWHILEDQYTAYGQEIREEIRKMIHSPEDDDVFNAGRQFAKIFPNALDVNIPSEHESTINGIKLDVLNFMRGIMDECTHLGNFSKPVDPELVTIVTATQDGYVPKEGFIPLTDLWKGSKLKRLECGHVTAILFNNDSFREAIIGSLSLNSKKYYDVDLMQ